MEINSEDMELFLSDYFAGRLDAEKVREVEAWRDVSEGNLRIYRQAKRLSESIDLLNEMKLYDAEKALNKVNGRIEQHHSFFFYWQRIAAVLILPILFFAIWNYMEPFSKKANLLAVTWQTIKTPPGVKSTLRLPDGTTVWLNSNTEITYPSAFVSKFRKVKVVGEAFFDVAKDKLHPFIVNLGKISVQAVGTRFNIINYKDDPRNSVVLESGKVNLLNETLRKEKKIAEMTPGQIALFDKKETKITITSVNTNKYSSWIDGRLIFEEDSMDEVVNKLNHWFNVNIEIRDPEINTYVYTATFQNESLEQILDLLKLSAPIDYRIIPGRVQKGQASSKERIILMKK